MLPKVSGRGYGYVFLLLSFLLPLLAILKWHWLLHLVINAGWLFLPMMVFLLWKFKSAIQLSAVSWRSCLAVWVSQGLLVVGTFCVVAQWQHWWGSIKLGMTPFSSFYVSIIVALIAMSCFAVMLSMLAHKKQQFISALLFFPDKTTADARLVIYGNTWFRRASLYMPLLMWSFSIVSLGAIWLKPIEKVMNPIAVAIVAVLMMVVIRAHWFYRLMQKLIKRWRFNFLGIILLCILLILAFGTMLSWLLQPVLVGLAINMRDWVTVSPEIILFGTAICFSVPLAFFIANHWGKNKPLHIILATLMNPLLWLLLWVDWHYHVLQLSQQLPGSITIIVNILLLIIASYWLASEYFSKLMVTLFGNRPDKHQGPMPRAIMQTSLPLEMQIIFIFMLQAPFLLEVEYLAISACIIMIYIWGFFLFLKQIR